MGRKKDKKSAEEKFKKQKNREKWSILYFFGSYGLFYAFALLYRLFLPSYTFTFNIAETGQEVQFTMSLSELADLVVLGIVFSINAFRSYYLLQDLTTENYTPRGRFRFLTGVIIMNFGVITHMVTNQLHEFVYSMDQSFIESNVLMENLAAGLYFWDEIVSHLFVGVGFLIMVMALLVIEWRNRSIETKLDQKKYLMMTFAVGCGFAIGMVEGQAALLISVVILVLFIICILKYKKKPFTYATLMFCAGYITFVVIYTLATGINDYYPYIKQFSEIL